MANETPSRPPPPNANAIKNFHFDFPHPSLTDNDALSLFIAGENSLNLRVFSV